jgi:hypothetical protein
MESFQREAFLGRGPSNFLGGESWRAFYTILIAYVNKFSYELGRCLHLDTTDDCRKHPLNRMDCLQPAQ